MIRRTCAWIAIVAMTLNALWPLLVTAQPKQIPNEICTVSGMKTLDGADAGHNMPASPAHHDHDKLSDCCTFCVGGVHAAPIAPALAGFALSLDPTPLLFASADAITWKCPYYLPSLSRGPPASPI